MDHKSGTTPSFVKVTDTIARITLQRPTVANRIQPDDLAVLKDLLAACEALNNLRVLILASQGKYFSAGYDLGSLPSESNLQKSVGQKSDFESFIDTWEQTPLITIAAVQGPVFGGSTDLVLASDFRIGTPAVTATMPAAKLGLHLYPGILKRYVSRLGLNHAKSLVLTAANFSHSQLQAMGFLTKTVPEDALQDHVMELAEQIAPLAPLSLRGMKGALNAAANGSLDEEQVRETIRRVSRSEDIREGLAAWQEKRTPRFSGS
jgi:enoyl-CoA hydratase